MSFNNLLLSISGLLLAFLLVSCSGLPAQNGDVSIARSDALTDQPWIENRQQALKDLQHWRIQGRFSLVTDDEAWSGRLDWHQQSQQEYLIKFSDPAGQGALHLVGGEGIVELHLANGDRYQAENADELLRKETNWALPISSLWYWVRALPDPNLSVRSEWQKQLLPLKMDQDSWHVSYLSYNDVDQLQFPRKITVEKDDLKLKLIITTWEIQ